jgi:hypothetical protein
MCTHPCYDCIALQPLSDETVVEILNFLQIFTLDFEIRYGSQIRRYYDDRSEHNIIAADSRKPTDDPPF